MAYETEFNEFWTVYPMKRDRLDALKAYQKARKAGVAHADILAGVAAYVQHKPLWQDWKHGATWLNKGGWLDEWEPVGKPVKRHWAEECAELHGGTCQKQWDHGMRMMDGRASSAGKGQR